MGFAEGSGDAQAPGCCHGPVPWLWDLLSHRSQFIALDRWRYLVVYPRPVEGEDSVLASERFVAACPRRALFIEEYQGVTHYRRGRSTRLILYGRARHRIQFLESCRRVWCSWLQLSCVPKCALGQETPARTTSRRDRLEAIQRGGCLGRRTIADPSASLQSRRGYPGGQVRRRLARKCMWRCPTVWPPFSPVLITSL